MAEQKSYNTPPLTVIIAMYNAEKYIEQALSSLLNQTFKDFEVIVADDCSTDKSLDIVKKIAPNFGGRLKIIRTQKNSGHAAAPRNAALKIAQGKYVTFLDSDDFFIDTALEQMYKIAQETDADVIHAQVYFQFTDGDNQLFQTTYQRTEFVNQPTLEIEDISVRVRKFIDYGFLWWSCNKLIRRDLIVKNAIEFPPLSVYEDMYFTFCLVTCAKRYVRVPNCFYCYRLRQGSLSHLPAEPLQTLRNLLGIMQALDEFMSRHEHFAKNPQDRYAFLDWHFQNKMNTICTIIYEHMKLQPYQVEAIFRREIFSAAENVSPMVSAYFFTTTSFYRLKLFQQMEEIKNLRSELDLARAQQTITNLAGRNENLGAGFNFERDSALKLADGFKIGEGN